MKKQDIHTGDLLALRRDDHTHPVPAIAVGPTAVGYINRIGGRSKWWGQVDHPLTRDALYTQGYLVLVADHQDLREHIEHWSGVLTEASDPIDRDVYTFVRDVAARIDAGETINTNLLDTPRGWQWNVFRANKLDGMYVQCMRELARTQQELDRRTRENRDAKKARFQRFQAAAAVFMAETGAEASDLGYSETHWELPHVSMSLDTFEKITGSQRDPASITGVLTMPNDEPSGWNPRGDVPSNLASECVGCGGLFIAPETHPCSGGAVFTPAGGSGATFRLVGKV